MNASRIFPQDGLDQPDERRTEYALGIRCALKVKPLHKLSARKEMRRESREHARESVTPTYYLAFAREIT